METSDYSRFVNFTNNRKISNAHIDKMAKSIMAYGYLDHCPILVTKDKEGQLSIVDGQHRFAACKKLGIPIKYHLIDYGKSHNSIIAMNSNQLQWKMEDYCRFYAGDGNETYQKILDIAEENKITIASVISLFKGTIWNSTLRQRMMMAYKYGNLKITDDDWERFETSKKRMNEIRFFSDNYKTFHSHPAFLAAIVVMIHHREYDHKRMLDLLEKKQALLVRCTSKVTYLRVLEDIYNSYLKQENRLKFI